MTPSPGRLRRGFATITPETKIATLLETRPDLESVLVSAVPAFQQLQQTEMWCKVTRIMSIAQAARVAGVPVDCLISTLHNGKPPDPAGPQPTTASQPAPDWVGADEPVEHFSVEALLAQNVHPLGRVREVIARIPPGRTVRLDSAFHPAPLIDVLRRGGLDVYSTEAAPGLHLTYVRAPEAIS